MLLSPCGLTSTVLRMSSTDDLERLCQLALSKGASAARPMSARGVIIDPRVRLKCMVPTCEGYGWNLMCPPNVMPTEQFAEVLRQYDHAILVQFPIPLDREVMKRSEGKRLEDVIVEADYVDRLAKSEVEFLDILGEVEKQAMSMGYRFATAFSGGACHLCKECVGQGSGERCRHPFRSRPSMEAMSIDVFLTAQNAGLPFEIPPRDNPVWNGLVLVD
jgi:predicted metal-binding protein